MNAQTKDLLAGANRFMSSHSLLASIFKTPIHKRRLRNAFGCTIQEISKKLKGNRGNCIKQTEMVMDLAFEIDCETGHRYAHAKRIVDHFFYYYKAKIEHLVGLDTDWRAEANEILREGTDVVIKLNTFDIDERDLPDLFEAKGETSQLQHKANLLMARIDAQIRKVLSESRVPKEVEASSVTALNASKPQPLTFR